MSGIFGVGSGDSSFFDNYFGSSQSNNNSNVSGFSTNNLLGDYAMIKSGAYTKLLKKYYAENPGESKTKIKDSKAADTTSNLLSMKSSAKKAMDSAKKLNDIDVEKANRDDLYKSAKSFVDDYNAMLDSVDNIESVSILQNALWMTKQTSSNGKVLDNIGIKIGADNKLSIDEKLFKDAKTSDIVSVFTGQNSLMSSIERRASQIFNAAGTQAILNSRNPSYNSSGAYNAMSSSNLINSLM